MLRDTILIAINDSVSSCYESINSLINIEMLIIILRHKENLPCINRNTTASAHSLINNILHDETYTPQTHTNYSPQNKDKQPPEQTTPSVSRQTQSPFPLYPFLYLHHPSNPATPLTSHPPTTEPLPSQPWIALPMTPSLF